MTTRITKALSLGDYIAANWLYQRKYWLPFGLLKIYGFAVALFFLMIVILTAVDEPLGRTIIWDLLRSSLLFGLAMVVVIPLVSAVKMLLTAKRHFREMAFDAPATYEFDEQGLRGANDEATIDLHWNRLYDYVQDRRVLLIRRTRRIFVILPKSQIAGEQLDEIVGFMRKAGVKER